MKTNFLLRGVIFTIGATAAALAVDDSATPPVTKSPSAAVDGEQVGIARRDGIAISGAEAYVTRNGITEKLVKNLELPSGVIVHPDGTVILSNHTSSLLQADQLLTFDGQIVQVPRDPNVNPAPPAAHNPTGSPAAANGSVAGGGAARSVFLFRNGTPFMGTVTAPGVITSLDGTTIPIDGSIRAVSFGANSVPSVGQLNANGTILGSDGSTIFPDGSVRNASGTLISPATAGRGVAVAPNMMNPQGTTTSTGVGSQPGVTNPQGTATQQGLPNQQGKTNQQLPSTTGGTTAPGISRQPGSAASRTQGNTPATNGNAGGAVTNGGSSAAGGAPPGGAAR